MFHTTYGYIHGTKNLIPDSIIQRLTPLKNSNL